MKTLVTLASTIILLSFSCKDEEKMGNCSACCDASGNAICKANFTDKMCADYNKNKVDGHDWSFIETTIACPPPKP